jgi:AhpD family alkylhydroperoxidase
MNIAQLAPDVYRAAAAMEDSVRKSGIDSRLLHLVKLRASQINGCAFCVDMHSKESLADGLNPQMLHLVSVWRESPYFDARDRAALEWAESVTLAAQSGVPDTAYDAMRAVFTEAEIAKLTFAICMINVWNRVAVAARFQHPM